MARAGSGVVSLRVPIDVILDACQPYLHGGKAIHRCELLHDDAVSIIAHYENRFRGVAEYYRLAYNLHRLGRLRWIMEQSLTKTLAHKRNTSVARVYRTYRTMIQTARGPRVALQATVDRAGKTPLVATWGRTRLIRDTDATLTDDPAPMWNRRTELGQRLLADTCELCGSRDRVQVHHVRALKDLNRPGQRAKPRWVQEMAARNRKTLVVCHACHTDIHAGRPTRTGE
jgi:Type II intron maturase